MGGSKKKSRSLSKAELEKLFSTAEKVGRRERLMISLSYAGALRVSELVHIRVRNFDFELGKMTVIPLRRSSRSRTPIEYELSPEVLLEVREYIKKEGLEPGSYLFPGRVKKSCKIVGLRCSGGHISKRQAQGIFDLLAKKAGVKRPGRGTQSLKHTRLLEVAEETKDPYAVQKLGRYGSPSMSFRYVEGRV